MDRRCASPLMAACRTGSLESVKFLIENGAKLGEVDDRHQTPLFCAAQKGHLDIVNFLFASSASRKSNSESDSDLKVNARDKSGTTALSVSVRNGHIGVVKCLVENGADLKIKDFSGFSVMHEAVLKDRKNIIKYLLQVGASASDYNPSAQESPLHIACDGGDIEIVKLLIESGVDINVKSCVNKMTPLMYACITGNLEKVKYLLEKGADISCVDALGDSVLYIACSSGNLEIVELLLNLAKQRVPQFVFPDLTKVSLTACEHNKLGIFKLLVEVGRIDVNKPHLFDRNVGLNLNLVQVAVRHGRVEILEYLLGISSVNWKVVVDLGVTLLHMAASSGHLPVVKLLMEKGGFTLANSRCEAGTPFVFACCHGHLNIVRYLVEKGAAANVNELDRYENTPLHASTALNQFEVVKYLISKGADVNAVSKSNVTPLDMALENNSHEIIKYLRQHGGISIRERGN